MRRGSITLQLSLALGLCLTLVLYSIRSVRIAEGRVLLASALEQGLYSLFAGYDRDLYDMYGLLFVDGGYGGRDFRPGQLCGEVKDAAEYITDPGKDRIGTVKTLKGVQLLEGEITGYMLATDYSGAAFAEQVSGLMTERLGAVGVRMLAAELTGQAEMTEDQEAYLDGADPEGALEKYEALEDSASEKLQADHSPETSVSVKRKGPAADLLTETAPAPEGEEPADIPEDFRNPIDTVRNLQKMGIISLAIPDPGRLSNFSLGDEQPVSRRSLQQGMGMFPEEQEGMFDKLLMLEFIAETFPCYTSGSGAEGLKYQVEYAVGGKNSDMENLKTVLNRLLLIREASNFIYLMTSAVRGAEADQLALIISSVLLMPQAQPLVSLILKLCWAYGESILDLRVLLDGGKIPLLKNDSSWQLSLSSLGNFFQDSGGGRSSEEGLDYTWYLRILLFMESQEKLTNAAMDLTEHNIRMQCGRPEFSLDSCIYAAEIKMTGRADQFLLSITRSYGYDM